MTSSTPVSLSALPRGYELPPASFEPSPERVNAYLEAIGDNGDYDGAVPPLAILALALEALQAVIRLPEGSLHTGQELEQLSPVRAGEPLVMNGRVAQRSERHGMVISVIEINVTSNREPVLRARTTIMAPVPAP